MELGASLQKWTHSQVAVGARVACYHDEIKLSLPATWTPKHHLLFTFFNIDMQAKVEAPKPVSSSLLPFGIMIILWLLVNVMKFICFICHCLIFCCFIPGGNWICSTSLINTCSVCAHDGIYSLDETTLFIYFHVRDTKRFLTEKGGNAKNTARR